MKDVTYKINLFSEMLGRGDSDTVSASYWITKTETRIGTSDRGMQTTPDQGVQVVYCQIYLLLNLFAMGFYKSSRCAIVCHFYLRFFRFITGCVEKNQCDCWHYKVSLLRTRTHSWFASSIRLGKLGVRRSITVRFS